MSDDAGPPRLADILDQSGSWIWVHRADCGCTKAVPLAPLIAACGREAPMPAAMKRMRCTTCGLPPTTISIPTSNGMGKAPTPIPLDYVPEAMRAWAKVDPAHLPALLRGPVH
jgi:hypothetical protein